MKPLAAFHVSPPVGNDFFVVVLPKDGVALMSNATGVWLPETRFEAADMAAPVHRLYEWDVKTVSVEETGYQEVNT